MTAIEFQRVISDQCDLECQRCGCMTDLLLRSWRPIDGGDIWEESGDSVPEHLREVMWCCVRCDDEMMNGAPTNLDPGEIMEDREEQEYYEDPINNPCPWGYQS